MVFSRYYLLETKEMIILVYLSQNGFFWKMLGPILLGNLKLSVPIPLCQMDKSLKVAKFHLQTASRTKMALKNNS